MHLIFLYFCCFVSVNLEFTNNCEQSVGRSSSDNNKKRNQYSHILDIYAQGWKHGDEVLKSEPCAGCIIHAGVPAPPALHSLKSLYLSWWKGQPWRHGAVVHCRRLYNNQRDTLAVLRSCHPAQWRERCQRRGPSANCCSVSSALSWKEENHWTGLEQAVLSLYTVLFNENMLLVELCHA